MNIGGLHSIRYIVAVGWDKRVNLFAVRGKLSMQCGTLLSISLFFFAVNIASLKDTGESLTQVQRPIEAWISATVSSEVVLHQADCLACIAQCKKKIPPLDVRGASLVLGANILHITSDNQSVNS